MKRQPIAPPCPGCGAQARVFKNGQSTCAYCGRTLEPLPFTHPGGVFAHQTWLRIGQKARIGGKEYVAIGRQQFQQNDEGELYTWEEWILLSQDGEARYLEFDEGKWTLSEAYSPSDPPPAMQLMGVRQGGMVRVAGQNGQVTDAGVCRVSGSEGEIPWPVSTGDMIRYVEIAVPNYGTLSAEFDPGTGEVEWYRGRQLDDVAVATMFGRNDIKQEAERQVNVQGDRRRFGCLAGIVALAALFGGCGALGAGKQIAHGSAVAAQIPDEGQRFGPYKLGQGGRVHRLNVSTNIQQTSIWVQAVLEDAQGGVIDTDRELWDESGVDSDGSWHESDLNASRDFRLAKAGNYYVRLFADPEAASSNATINFALEQRSMYAPYLITFGVISLGLGGIFWMAGAPGTRKKLSEQIGNMSSD